MRFLLTLILFCFAGQSPADPVVPLWVTHGEHVRVKGAKQALWLRDSVLFSPFSGGNNRSTWKPYSVRSLLQGNAASPVAAGGIVWANAENGNTDHLVTSLRRLKAIHGEVPIGCFVNSHCSVYREMAWSSHNMPKAAAAWRGHHDAIIDHLDYITVYAYRLTPDRADHKRAVISAITLARQVYPNHPVFLGVWTHIHPNANQWKGMRGKGMPATELAWEAKSVWPFSDGVVLFSPHGLTDDQVGILEKDK